MSTPHIQVIATSAKGKTAEFFEFKPTAGTSGQVLRIHAKAGVTFQIKDLASESFKAPATLKVKRVGKNLEITLLTSTEGPDLVLENYFDMKTDGFASIVGEAENGHIYEYTVTQASADTSLILVAETQGSVNAVLGSAEFIQSSGSAFGLQGTSPLFAALGILGIAGAGLMAKDTQDTAATAAALKILQHAAQANNASASSTSLETFASAGISGVSKDNLAAINNALNSYPISGERADTAAKVQAIVDAYNAILAKANDPKAPDPTTADFAAIGVTGIHDRAQTKLLIDALIGKGNLQISSVDELNNLAKAASAVASVKYDATGKETIGSPSKADLATLGFTHVTDENLEAVQNAIAQANAKLPLSSLKEVKKVIDSALAASATSAAIDAVRAATDAAKAAAAATAAVSNAQDKLSTPPTPAELKAVTDAQAAATNAAAAAKVAADAAKSAVDAAKAAIAVAGEIAPTALNAAETAATAAQAVAAKNVTEAASAVAAAENATHTAVDKVVDKATAAVTAAMDAAKAAAAATAAVIAAQDKLDNPPTPAELKAVADAQTAATTAAADAKGAADAANAAVDLAKAATAAAGETASTRLNAAESAATTAQTAAAKGVTDAAKAAAAAETTTDMAVAAYGSAATAAATAATAAATAADTAQAELATALAALATSATPAQLADVEAKQAAAKAAAAEATATAQAASAAATAAHLAAVAAGEGDPAGVATASAAAEAANTAAASANTAAANSEDATDTEVAKFVSAAETAATALSTATSDLSTAHSNLATAIATMTSDPATAAQIKAVEDAQTALNTAASKAANAATAATNAAATATDAASAGNEVVPASVSAIASQVSAANAAISAATAASAASETATDTEVTKYVSAATGANSALATAQTDFNAAQTALTSALTAMSDPATTTQLTDVETAKTNLLIASTALASTSTTAQTAINAAQSAATAAMEMSDFSAITSAISTANTATAGVIKTLALATIAAAAQGNTAIASSPSVADYAAAGVTVDATRLASMNNALNDADVKASNVNSSTNIQNLVSSYNVILSAADGDAGNAGEASPKMANYTAIGIYGVDTAAKESLLSDSIDSKSNADVNTVAKIQALADSVKTVMDVAALTSSTDLDFSTYTTLQNALANLGVSGMNDYNVGALWVAIRDSDNGGSGVNTLSKLQAMVNVANDTPKLLNTDTNLAVVEDTARIMTVSDLLAGQFSDPDTGSTLKGIAIDNVQTNNTQGSWSYSKNGGTTWTDFPSGLSAAGALFVNATDQLRFVPVANWSGRVDKIGCRVVDNTMPDTVTGTIVSVGYYGRSGGPMSAIFWIHPVITAVNDAPVITLSSVAMNYTEQESASAINSAINVSDIDSTNLTGATIAILPDTFQITDVLSFANGSTIKGTYDSATGVMTLTGNASLAEYKSALQRVMFNSTSDTPGASRTIQWTVTDGLASSNVGSSAINITQLNDAPRMTDADGWILNTLAATGETALASDPLGEGTTTTQNSFSSNAALTGAGTNAAQVFDATYTSGVESNGQYSMRNGTTDHEASDSSYGVAFNFAPASATAAPYKVFSQFLTGAAGSTFNAGFWAKDRASTNMARFTFEVLDGTTVIATGDTGQMNTGWKNYLSSSFIMPASGKVTIEITNVVSGSGLGNDPALDDIGLVAAARTFGQTNYSVTGQTGASTDNAIVLNNTGPETVNFAFSSPVGKVTASWTGVDTNDDLQFMVNGKILTLNESMFAGTGVTLSVDKLTAKGEGVNSTYSMTINAADVPDGVINNLTLVGTGDALNTNNFIVTPMLFTDAQTVSQLFSGVYSDAESHTMKGVVITFAGSATDFGTLGVYDYSSDNGLTWTSLASNLSDSNALFLAATDQIRFVRALDNPSATNKSDLIALLVEDAGLSTKDLTSGATVDVSGSKRGGTSAFSDSTITLSDKNMTGTAAADTITGTNSADNIVGAGGADTISAGAGDDIVTINASNVTQLATSGSGASVDGGTGINMLLLSGSDIVLDLTSSVVAANLKNFSTVDLTGSGDNTLKLSLTDVLSMPGAVDNALSTGADESHMLVVNGNAGDVVQLASGSLWAQTSTGLSGTSLGSMTAANSYGSSFGFAAGHTYALYTHSGASLFMDELVQLNTL